MTLSITYDPPRYGPTPFRAAFQAWGWAQEMLGMLANKCDLGLPTLRGQTMTETEWLTSEDPAWMLRALKWGGSEPDPRGSPIPNAVPLLDVSERKLELFAESCRCDSCEVLAHGRGAAFWADSISKCESCNATQEQKAAILRSIVGNPFQTVAPLWEECEFCAGSGTRLIAHGEPSQGKDPWKCEFCHATGRTTPYAWLTPAIVEFAQGIYDQRDWDSLGALADMLEDVGCPLKEPCWQCDGKGNVLRHCEPPMNPFATMYYECEECRGTGEIANPVLAHLRAPGVVRCRGDWALDLLLGKE